MSPTLPNFVPAARPADPGVPPLGEVLMAAGAATREGVEKGLERQRQTPGRLLGETLVEMGEINAYQLLDGLHKQLEAEQEAYRRQFDAPQPLIRFEKVEKVLDGRRVLDGIDLAIPAGRITAIIGVSGGGKSVTIKHMIGLMKPDKGKVWVGDEEITALSTRRLQQVRRRFSLLFQGGALFDSLNVYDNVAFPLRENTKLSEEEIRVRVERRLAQVNLTAGGGKFPDELSGGMLKRAALARALVTDPEIILLDEPTAGLDPIIENAIHHLICDTYLRSRYTMVFISHAVPEIFHWCHHMVVLHQGRVLAAGPARAIQESDDPVIRQFIHGRLEGPIKVV